ncbi:MAG: glycosyltransferase [Deltaproteobacteria bacterium]|nr:glycosyltransferase [Deltaproteobacteria bacterium]
MKKQKVLPHENTPPSSAPRKPRLLWANAYCLLDTSSGASMAVREMLRQLVISGYEVNILGATIFDNERGQTILKPFWSQVEANRGGSVRIHDEVLQHLLVVTESPIRKEMRTREEELWFGLLLAYFNEFQPDVVFFYGGKPLDMLMAAEARAHGVAVAAYLVNGNYSGQIWCRNVDLILTDSRATADRYAHTEGYAVTPVGAFIDPSQVVAKTHSRERILFINPSVQKGVGLVIQLALLLEKRRPDIVFEVVESRGSWQQMLETFSAALGTPRRQLDNVVLTPNTKDMRPLYGRTRLLLAPSLWWESGARVLAEAMLNGIPAIVTDSGGSPEMIGDGGIKLQLPPACYEKPYNTLPKSELLDPLIERIIRLYDDDVLYETLAARALAVGQSRHSLYANTKRLTAALEPLIGRSRNHAPAIEDD